MTFRFIFTLLILLYGTLANAASPVSKIVKAYKGNEGIEVYVVNMEPKANKQVLIEVKGSDTAFDNLVLIYTEETNGTAKAYVMEYEGQKNQRLRVDQNNGSTLYLPGIKPISLSYDEKVSKKTDSELMYKRYLDVVKQKTQEKMARFDREKNMNEQKTELTKLAKTTEKACGKPVPIDVDWKSIDDDKLKRLSIYTFCGETLSQIADFCAAAEKNKQAVTKKIDNVRCSFGEKLRARLDQKSFIWVTEENGPNQGEFVRNFLANEL